MFSAYANFTHKKDELRILRKKFRTYDMYSLKITEEKWEKLNIRNKESYGLHRMVSRDGFIFGTFS